MLVLERLVGLDVVRHREWAEQGDDDREMESLVAILCAGYPYVSTQALTRFNPGSPGT